MCVAAILVARFPVFVLSEDVGVEIGGSLWFGGGFWMMVIQVQFCRFAWDRWYGGVLKNFVCSFYVFVLFIVHCFVLGLFD